MKSSALALDFLSFLVACFLRPAMKQQKLIKKVKSIFDETDIYTLMEAYSILIKSLVFYFSL